jgi:hypothetical protein
MLIKYILGIPYVLFWSIGDYISRDLSWCYKKNLAFKGIFINNWNLWLYCYERGK